MSPVPPPRKSPNVPRDEEEDFDNAAHDHRSITGVYKIVEDQRKKWRDILIFIGVIAGGLMTIGKIASAQTDAGIKNTIIRVEQLEQAHKNHIEDEHQVHLEDAKRFDRVEDQNDVINKKLTLLLDEAQVARWKRPVEVPLSRDGGK